MRNNHATAQPFPWLLILVFLVMAAGIGYTGYRFYLLQAEQFTQKARDQLDAIAGLKVGQIASWRTERLGDGQIVQGNPLNVEAAQNLFVDPSSTQTRANILEWMSALASAYHYAEISLLDGQGRVTLSLSGKNTPLNPAEAALAAEAMQSGQVGLSDLYAADSTGQIRLDVVAPLMAPVAGVNTAIGAVVLDIDPYQYLYPLIQSWPIPSSSGETLLVQREGSEVVFLNELRFQKGTALKLRFPLTSPNLPAALAVQGQTSVTQGVDYRGVAVLWAARHVPDSSWYLVAKVDQQEILGPLAVQERLTSAVTAALILFAAAMAFLLARQQSLVFLRKENDGLVQRHILLTRLENLVKYANDIIFLADSQENILEANDRAVQAYGYSHDELLHMTLRQLRTPGSRQSIETDLHRLEQSSGEMFETQHQRKDGSIFPVEVSASLIEETGLHYSQEIIRDISSRKQAEEQIRRLNQDLEERVLQRTAQLEETNRELNAFTYSVSHDLRAPLRAIDGFSNILLEDFAGSLTSEAQRYLNLVRSNSQHMGRLVDDLLSLSRFSHQALNKENVLPANLARRAVKELKGEIGSREVEIKIMDMPAFLADPGLLYQVYFNLLSNAIKFTGRVASAAIEVGSSESPELPGQAVYFVKDNGAGFDMRYVDKLFGVFQRLHRMEEYEGTGVGLAIVQRIILRHGGRVWAQGELNKGAAFYFTIGDKDGNH